MKKSNPVERYFDRLAPSWDSLPVENPSEMDSLLRSLGIQKGDKVVDIACGTGVISAKLHALSSTPVVGIDLSEKMIAIAQRKYRSEAWAHFVQGDFLDYPEANVFDFAVIYDAYPHFLDPKALSKALKRVLVPQGRFAIVHSLSRKELHEHHEGLGEELSRDLLPAEEEARFFEEDFRILKAEEGPHSFLILGVKKD
jgi:ubiquinone/menaquinone biosynthesis C-methylase UbiE